MHLQLLKRRAAETLEDWNNTQPSCSFQKVGGYANQRREQRKSMSEGQSDEKAKPIILQDIGAKNARGTVIMQETTVDLKIIPQVGAINLEVDASGFIT